MRRVLITGAGSAGIKGTLYSLKIAEKLYTIGVDCNNDVLGRYLCDSFYQILPSNNQQFISSLISLCQEKHVDALLPQVNEELSVLSLYRKQFEDIGTRVAISSNYSISSADNKATLINLAKQLNVPYPRFYVVESRTELEDAISKLGYPEKRVVVKPPMGRGMQGFRIIDGNIDRVAVFFREKPESASVVLKMEELDFLGEKFPTLLVMEYLSGPEYTVDVLGKDGKAVIVVPRRRIKMRTGITFNGITEQREDIIKYSEILTDGLKLDYAHGYQFKEDSFGIPKILECNPRIQGSMVAATLAGANIIYGAYKLCFGEKLPPFKVKWGTQLVRDWGGICVRNNKKVGEF